MGIAGDDEHIYLLDNNSGRTIHAYDYDFKHQYKFSIDWSTLPSTFISLWDGFLFQNGSENDSIGKFVFTDNQGRTVSFFATPAASFATIIHLRTRAHAQESTFAALLLK